MSLAGIEKGQTIDLGAIVVVDPTTTANQMAVNSDGSLNNRPAGASAYNTSANTAGYQVKSGAGILRGVTVNTVGTTSSATFYDGTSTSGTKLATMSTLSQTSLTYDVSFTTGLFVVLAGGVAADVTIRYN